LIRGPGLSTDRERSARQFLPRLSRTRRVYAYDFAQNHVPGVQAYEEPAYWRDVGTLAALAAAQQDALGSPPRFNLWNRRWPIRGEYDAVLFERIQAVRTPAPWQAANRDRRTDERLPAS
jgi:ADP-glucose pyrophosphorylase